MLLRPKNITETILIVRAIKSFPHLEVAGTLIYTRIVPIGHYDSIVKTSVFNSKFKDKMIKMFLVE